MLPDYAVADAQSETRPLAPRFRRVEGFPYLVDDALRNAHTAVVKYNPEAGAVPRSSHLFRIDLQAFLFMPFGILLIQGISGVADDIHEDLLHLLGIADNSGEVAGDGALDLNPL